ncbi:MAG TPA: hypothetical protein VJ998_04665 [Pseudomonadales bacterium]|nr:hypothetical protein [Pseudomonadales bacterium]
MSRKQRKLKNMLVNPGFQLKLTLYYVVSGLVFFGAIVGLSYTKLSKVRHLMNDNPLMNFQIQSQVNDLMFQVIQFTLLGFVAYIILSSLFALIISHKIAGPVVAIRAFIEQLKMGNYDYKRNLRPNDELNEIMDALKELAPLLKERTKED